MGIVKIKLNVDSPNYSNTNSGMITDQSSIEAIKRIRTGQPRFQVVLIGGNNTHPTNWSMAVIIGGVVVDERNFYYSNSGQVVAIGYNTASDRLFSITLAGQQFKIKPLHEGLKL